MSIYLDLEGFKDASVLPEEFVDDIEAVRPGWLARQLELKSRWIDARLRKRYEVPFGAHDDATAEDRTPVTVQDWLVRLVSVRLMMRRGVDPDDAQFITVNEDARMAAEEILEASNSMDGWFDLPLKRGKDGTAISKANPQSYSETSPYVWTDQQVDTAVNEDQNGGGSSV